MNNYRKKKILILSFLGISLFIIAAFIQNDINKINRDIKQDDNVNNIGQLKVSGHENPIEINGSTTGVGAHNWTWAQAQPWCTGNGTESEPYIIEDIIINGVSSNQCIGIYESNEYFIIRNSTFYNSRGTAATDSGIKLLEVTNGKILNSYCLNNTVGIYMYESSYNTIAENSLYNNSYYGIQLYYNSSYNTISDNTMNNNIVHGLTLSTTSSPFAPKCTYNTIFKNNLSYNENKGIFLQYSDNNNITENLVSFNEGEGMHIMWSDANIVYKNYFLNNTNHAQDQQDPTFLGINDWNNTVIGNYWDNHTTGDADGDGIDDTDYTYITGTVNSVDYLPIYGNPFHDGSKIHIDGNQASGNKSWIWSSTRAWCSGSGGSGDPYIISDLTIDAANDGSCILIGNSSDLKDQNFKIEDCELKNPGIAVSDACIEFVDTHDGIISFNTLSYCDYGVYLLSSDNHLIINNTIYYNVKCVEEIISTGNTIDNNTCIQPVTWDETPTDQAVEYNTDFQYDLNATSAAGIDHWDINNTDFAVDGNGIITNNTFLDVGVHWLRVQAVDVNSYYAVAIINVTVSDPGPPIWIDEPSDQLLEYGNDYYFDANATDLSGIDYYELNDTTYFDITSADGIITNKGLLGLGVYSLEARAYDPYGYYCSANFSITVQDTTDPTWDFVPTDQIVEFGDGLNYDLDASDASGIPDWWLNDTTYFTINDANGIIINIGQVPVGVHYLEVRAYDPYNQFCSATFKITVEDTTDPTWDFMPIDQNIEFGDGLNYDLDASDTSGIPDWWLNDTTYFTINDANGIISNTTSLNVGIYWLEVRAYDPYSNYATADFKITVEDTTDPTWDFAPTDQTIEFGDSLNYDLDASDASGIDDWWLNDTTYFTINDANGVITNIGQVPVGVHYLEVRAYDPYSNYRAADIKITVEDTTDPTWDFTPTDQTIEFGDSLNYDLDASDASGIPDWWLNDTTYFTINDANGVITNIGQVPVGVYYLEVRANDPYSNYATADIKITVEDTTDPTWDVAPTDQNIEFGDGLNYDLDASDASGIPDWWLNDTTYFTINDANGIITNTTSLNVGIYWLEVRAYDPYTNYATATFRVIVLDTDDPVWVQLPVDQIVEIGDSISYDLNATDASGISNWWLNDTTYFTINDANGIITNIGLVPVGVHYLEVRASDPYNQNCSATFKITVEDTTDPTWDFAPTDQNIEFGDGLNYDLDASDASGIPDWWLNDTTYFTINDANGIISNTTSLNVGIYWLEVRAYDPYSNYATADIKITVEDTTDPTWIQIPTDQSIEFGDGLDYDINATDASGISDWWLNDTTYFAINDANGIISNTTLLSAGIYWLEVRAIDPYGQYCSAIIKITVVQPTIPPSDQDITIWIIVIGSASVIGLAVIIYLVVRKRRKA